MEMLQRFGTLLQLRTLPILVNSEHFLMRNKEMVAET
jgi:hypothetical protein